jgi:Domain of unknown function (DUF4388)
MHLTGDLQKVNLGNLVQLIRNGGLTGKIALSCGAQQGLICFENGSIVHAEQELAQGRETLMELFLWNKGTFSFIEGDSAVAQHHSIDPKDPQETIESLLRDGIAYSEQQEFLEQMNVDGSTVFSLVLDSSKNLEKYDEDVKAVFHLFNGRKPLSDILNTASKPRRIIVDAVYNLIVDQLITVHGKVSDRSGEPVDLPEWVVQRLKQDNPDVSKAIVDMVIWADRLKCWLYQADTDFQWILKEFQDTP